MKAFFCFYFGAIVGSLLNVCIHRMPREESIVEPGSRCIKCGRSIEWFHNIPILSYFMLGGRCAHCGESFSIRYAVVEFITALCWLYLWNLYKLSGLWF